MEAVVRVSSPEFMRTRDFDGLAVRVLERFPEMRRHRCECGSARGIARELADTETPHLLEHVALELLALEGASRSNTRGDTTWDFEKDGRGVFRVRITCAARADASAQPEAASVAACDVHAIERALSEACATVNRLLGATDPV